MIHARLYPAHPRQPVPHPVRTRAPAFPEPGSTAPQRGARRRPAVWGRHTSLRLRSSRKRFWSSADLGSGRRKRCSSSATCGPRCETLDGELEMERKGKERERRYVVPAWFPKLGLGASENEQINLRLGQELRGISRQVAMLAKFWAQTSRISSSLHEACPKASY